MDDFKDITITFLFNLKDYVIRMGILAIQAELDIMKIEEDCNAQLQFFYVNKCLRPGAVYIIKLLQTLKFKI